MRARLADDLARVDPAATMEFLLALLDTESSPLVRQRIVDRLGRHAHARVREALERVATSDPDVSVSLVALERLRVQRTEEMRQLLWKRMELARASGSVSKPVGSRRPALDFARKGHNAPKFHAGAPTAVFVESS